MAKYMIGIVETYCEFCEDKHFSGYECGNCGQCHGYIKKWDEKFCYNCGSPIDWNTQSDE